MLITELLLLLQSWVPLISPVLIYRVMPKNWTIFHCEL